MDYKVHAVFPKVMCEAVLDCDTTELFDLVVKEKTSYYADERAQQDGFHIRNPRLLDAAPHWKEIILEPFRRFVENTLHLEGYDFVIASSWGVATPPGKGCQLHSHSNSFYSGVLHFEDLDTGELVFHDIRPKNFLLGTPTKHNQYNSPHFISPPKKNRVLFFPSEIHHKIMDNNSDDYRHSLAFNILPTGTYGILDGTVTVNIL